MEELKTMTFNAAAERAELRKILILIAGGLPLIQACREARISVEAARRRMAKYPEILSDFKAANDALMRSQLLAIVGAKNDATNKLVDLVKKTDDAETLMRLSSHLNNEADRIQTALNTEGSSRDDEVRKIMGINRKAVNSRMEITINLQGESTKTDTDPPIVIDAVSS